MSTETAQIELTRGSVKTAMKEVGATSSDLWRVKPSDLHVIPGFNGRVHNKAYDEHVDAIANSIIENGFYQDKPLAGYVAQVDGQNVIYITEGHSRRLAALKAIEQGAQLETVPVVIKPNGTSLEDLTIALITSNNGKPFTPYETGLVIKRLIDMGMDEKVVAKRLGYGKAYVSGLLSLVGAPKSVRDLVQDDKVSASMAIAAIKEHGDKAATHLKAAVDTAKAAGKDKATPKHAKAAAAPKEVKPKVVAQVVYSGYDTDHGMHMLHVILPEDCELAEGDTFVLGKITKAKAEAADEQVEGEDL